MTSKDTTFTSFTPSQAAAYASSRGSSYPSALYDQILNYHSGERNIVFDVGTGPGQVVFDLLEFFPRAFGCDTSVHMIEQAKKRAVELGVAERTQLVVAGGEECADALAGKEKVDLVTVAMAAHWFDLAAFYASAVSILRPGGTLAMWTCSSQYVHPSTPNHQKIQEVLFNLEDHMLAPFRTPGNLLSRNAYGNLAMPWDFNETKNFFRSSSLERKDWDLDGIPSAPNLRDGSPGPFIMDNGKAQTTQSFTNVLSSASMVIK